MKKEFTGKFSERIPGKFPTVFLKKFMNELLDMFLKEFLGKFKILGKLPNEFPGNYWIILSGISGEILGKV